MVYSISNQRSPDHGLSPVRADRPEATAWAAPSDRRRLHPAPRPGALRAGRPGGDIPTRAREARSPSAAYTSSQAPSTLFPVFNPPVDTIPETFLTLQQMWRPLVFLGPTTRSTGREASPRRSPTTPPRRSTTSSCTRRSRGRTERRVTANDQLYEWNLIKADCTPKACNWFYSRPTFPSAVSRFEVTGKYTFRLHLKEPLSPNYMTLNNLTSLTPLPAHAWTTHPTTHKSMCSDATCNKPAQALANFKLLFPKLGADPDEPALAGRRRPVPSRPVGSQSVVHPWFATTSTPAATRRTWA